MPSASVQPVTSTLLKLTLKSSRSKVRWRKWLKSLNSISDKNSLEWVRADKFLVEDYDPSQIVTAADNDSGDGGEDPITYDGDLSNWRINGKFT